jgi:L-fuculose-phosphate aldolase
MAQTKNMNEFELKKMICEIGRRVWMKGFVAANDGNISVKLNDKEVLTTPTGVSKGFMTPDMIIKIDRRGKVLSGNSKHRPTSETQMHLAIYDERSDVGSVLHAHPPYCTSFAVANIPLDKCVLPEAIIVIGAVPIAAYGLPSTNELPDAIRPLIKNSEAVLMQNHGALTVGPDVLTAYHRMETLEHTAKIVHLARQLGNVNVLPQNEVDRLMDLRPNFNIPGRITGCQAAPVTAKSATASSQQNKINDQTVRDITNRVLERLKT